ncbi:MAG: flavodoxin family protein [Anaerolineales bacterium]
MKAVVIFDSAYGNTQQVAQAIGGVLGTPEDVKVLKVNDVSLDHLLGLELLIVGSPTQRFRPTAAISNMLNGISQNGLEGIKVAAFDTRLTMHEINDTPVLAFFVRISGDSAYAAKHIADRLKKKGGQLIVPPEGFYVEGMEGPLAEGELERAVEWTKRICAEV